MPKALFIATADVASAAQEGEFNQWLDERHVPDLFREVDQITAATRYRVTNVEVLPGGASLGCKYVTLYELEAANEADLQRCAQMLREAIGRGGVDISPALDASTATASLLLPIGDRRTS